MRGGEAGRDASKVLCFPSLGIHNIYMMIICFSMNERPLPRGLGVCGGRGEGEWKRCLKDSFSFPSSASILYIYICFVYTLCSQIICRLVQGHSQHNGVVNRPTKTDRAPSCRDISGVLRHPDGSMTS